MVGRLARRCDGGAALFEPVFKKQGLQVSDDRPAQPRVCIAPWTLHLGSGRPTTRRAARIDPTDVHATDEGDFVIQQQLENPLATLILSGGFGAGDTVKVTAEGGALAFSKP